MTSRVPIRQDRTLFNPKFEGYKLSFLEESCQHFVPVGAPGPGVVVPKLPPSAKLSYREVQSRIRHNHLHPGWNSFKTANGDSSSTRDGLLFVIDGDYMLLSLQFDKANHILVSDGASTFYLIRLSSTGVEHEAIIEASTSFRPQDQAWQDDETVSCGLMEAKAFPIIDSNNEQRMEVKFLVHYTHKEAFYSSEPSPHHKSDKKTVFVVSLCSIIWNPIASKAAASTDASMEVDVADDSGPSQAGIAVLPNRVIHSIRGTDIPFYCAIDPSNEGYVIGSSATYKPTVEPVIDQKSKYLEPGSAAMELDGTDVGNGRPSEPPYIWTQTDTDVTICFALPRGTTKHAILCKFSLQALQLQVNLSQAVDQMVRTPALDNMPLFDVVQADECFWTLEPTSGILTISLEKKHSKTRWTQVFAEGADSDPVEETLDPSVFAEYKAALEKYTTDQANAGPGRDSSIFPSIAQDAQEDIDEEGEEIKFSWIQSEEGAGIIRATTIGTGHDWIGHAFPSFESNSAEDQAFRMPTVCLKHDVDGLVYSIHHTPGSTPSTSTVQQTDGVMSFVHSGTFDALAFVQASKREKRFVMHDPHGRFAVIVESSRNVYIYWHTAGAKLKHERQTVVDVSKGQQVDIIGCQLIGDGILVILMEGKHGALVLELGQV
ncbi:hypothetical protein EC968_007967 [Mortierella alpina]|nr:hypothetical protein EC968_007967 [Mortierella alpina]